MAVKLPAAQNRMFKNVFIDRRTNRKIRASPLSVISGKIRGRGKGGSKSLRPKRIKKK